MIRYQTAEVDGTYKLDQFTYIILPRTIFAASGLQLVFLLLTLCFRRLMWTREPTKPARIYAVFLFLAMSILPALLMMVGPGQQIYFLMLYLIAFGLNKVLECVSEENSLFQYTIYALVMQAMYQVTGHPLDFMSLKIQRAFVGFPEFSTATNFSLVFFETVGVFSFMMVIVPLLRSPTEETAPTGIVPNTYKKCDQNDPEAVELSPRAETEPVLLPGSDEGRTELQLIKNYLTILLNFEMVHNGMTRYIVMNFSEMFFAVSPIEFTFRFIDWYIYILTFGYAYIIGKI